MPNVNVLNVIAPDENAYERSRTRAGCGEKRTQHEHQEGNRVHVERSFGSFARAIPFDVEVDEDNATAEMKNGVLTVRVPKSSKAIKGAKKLSIKTF